MSTSLSLRVLEGGGCFWWRIGNHHATELAQKTGSLTLGSSIVAATVLAFSCPLNIDDSNTEIRLVVAFTKLELELYETV